MKNGLLRNGSQVSFRICQWSMKISSLNYVDFSEPILSELTDIYSCFNHKMLF